MTETKYDPEIDPLMFLTMREPLRKQVADAIFQIKRLKSARNFVKSKQETVFGRHSAYPILRTIELAPLARNVLGTELTNFGDWLSQVADGDIDRAYNIIRKLVKTNLQRKQDESDELRLLREFGNVVDVLSDLLRKNSYKKVSPPFCYFCWRHPRDFAKRLYCIEHAPERGNEIKLRDNSGYMAGRRFISSVGKILKPEATPDEINNPSNSYCNQVWSSLKKIQEDSISDWNGLNEARGYIYNNSDVFSTEMWPVLTGYCDQYCQCLPKAKDRLTNIASHVDSESREDWVMRVLKILDNLDAYDDILANPDHILGLLSRYDQYLIAMDLLLRFTQTPNNFANKHEH